MSTKDLEILLYRQKLNQTTLMEMLPMLSKTTVTHLLRDLTSKLDAQAPTQAPDNIVHIFTD